MMRLSEKQKRYMCGKIARFETRTAILNHCISEFALDDTPEVRTLLYRKIDYFQGHPNARRWQDYIEQARSAYLDDLDSVPLANRKMRIIELARFYQRCTERLRDGEEGVDPEKVATTALKILKQIREEADALLARRTGDEEQGTGFEGLSDDELLETARSAGVRLSNDAENALRGRRGG